MPQHPYDFSARSRQAMIDAITDVGGNSWGYHERYPITFNIKVHSFDWMMGRKGGEKVNPALDDTWEAKIENDPHFFDNTCEEALNYHMEGDYTSYPGDDQGDWEFAQMGRSGGWLVLERWDGRTLRGLSADDFAEELADAEEWSMSDLRKFYKGIQCLKRDLSKEQIYLELEHHANFRRYQWEQEEGLSEAVLNDVLEQLELRGYLEDHRREDLVDSNDYNEIWQIVNKWVGGDV